MLIECMHCFKMFFSLIKKIKWWVSDRINKYTISYILHKYRIDKYTLSKNEENNSCNLKIGSI